MTYARTLAYGRGNSGTSDSIVAQRCIVSAGKHLRVTTANSSGRYYIWYKVL